MTAPRLAAGEYVVGKYMVRQQVREDGAISTHFAVDQAGKEFVLKLYSPAVGQRADLTAALQALHAQVNALPPELAVHVVDAGVDTQRGNALFTATEKQPLVALPKVTPETCGSVLRALAKTFATAHGRGLFHGALKPTNVLVDSATPRIVRLVDFGMNLVRAAVPTDAGFAHAAPWMAPEQIDGAPASGAVDVFSLGLVVFHALVGAPFWRMDRFRDEIKAQRTPATQRAAELGASIPPTLDGVFARALAVAPQQRFATVAEFSTAFDQAVASAKAGAAKPASAASSLKSTQYAADPQPAKPASSLKSTQYAADPKIEVAKLAAQKPPPPPGFDTLLDGPPAAALAAKAGPPPVPASSPPPQQPQQPPWEAQAAPMQPAPMATPSLAPPPPKSSKAPLIIVLVLLVLGGGGAAAWFFLLRGEPPTKTAQSDSKKKSDDEADKGDDDDGTSKKKTKKNGVDQGDDDKTEKKGDDDDKPAAAGASASASETAKPSASAEVPADAVEVTISCNPACDAITVDGKPLADPTAPAQLSPGTHTVVASKVGYKSANDTFTVKPKTPVTRVYTLAMLPATAVAAPKPTCGKFLKKCE